MPQCGHINASPRVGSDISVDFPKENGDIRAERPRGENADEEETGNFPPGGKLLFDGGGSGGRRQQGLAIEDPTEVGKCIFINVNNRTGYSNFKER